MTLFEWDDSTISTWAQIKVFIGHVSGVSNDAMHVLAGAGAFLLLATIFRVQVHDLRPWILVLILQLVNEYHDMSAANWPNTVRQWAEGTKDTALTMAIPTLILLLARFHPALFRTRTVVEDLDHDA